MHLVEGGCCIHEIQESMYVLLVDLHYLYKGEFIKYNVIRNMFLL